MFGVEGVGDLGACQGGECEDGGEPFDKYLGDPVQQAVKVSNVACGEIANVVNDLQADDVEQVMRLVVKRAKDLGIPPWRPPCAGGSPAACSATSSRAATCGSTTPKGG